MKATVTSNNRLYKKGLVAAITSAGSLFYSVFHGSQDSHAVWFFLLRVCVVLQKSCPNWREIYTFYLDNAAYHKSRYVMGKLRTYSVPVLFSGPYSYEGAPIEKVFGHIK